MKKSSTLTTMAKRLFISIFLFLTFVAMHGVVLATQQLTSDQDAAPGKLNITGLWKELGLAAFILAILFWLANNCIRKHNKEREQKREAYNKIIDLLDSFSKAHKDKRMATKNCIDEFIIMYDSNDFVKYRIILEREKLSSKKLKRFLTFIRKWDNHILHDESVKIFDSRIKELLTFYNKKLIRSEKGDKGVLTK